MLRSGPAVLTRGRLAPGAELRPLALHWRAALPHLPDPGELLERCRRGDEAAWADLVSHYEAFVYSTARNAGLDRDAADDVFQQVWLEFYRSLLRIRKPGAVTQWLITTTRRIAYRHAITRNRWVSEVRDDMAGPSTAMDEAVEIFERRHELEAALASLDERCNQVLRMLYFSEGKVSYAALSRSMGLSENSIGSLRTRCLERLRAILRGTP